MSNESLSSYPPYPLIGPRSYFYFLHPKETYFKNIADVPPLIARVVPTVIVIMILEKIFMAIRGKSNLFRLHVLLVNTGSMAMYDAFNLFIFRGLEVAIYKWIYDNYSFYHFVWNSFYTYSFALIVVDMLGYWWHRGSHEIAIMWASHELHHSCEDYNMSVAFRNSAPMRFFKWMFYLPLAFIGLPPPIMIVHSILGAAYNGSCHLHDFPKFSKIIPGIGHAIEYIFVTPSHHRVHHGSNKYCIDTNYGQYLIIWDRLFGTFAEESEDEPIVYGTLTQETTYNIGYLQYNAFERLLFKFKAMDTFGDKFRVLFYGPGWSPGKPRLGDIEEIPDIKIREKFDPTFPTWVSTYLITNAACVFFSYIDMASRIKVASRWIQFINLIYIFYGFSAIGAVYDSQPNAAILEFIRIAIFLIMYPIAYLVIPNLTPFLNPSRASYLVVIVHVCDLIVLPYLRNYVRKSRPSELGMGKVTKNVSLTTNNIKSKQKTKYT